MAIDPKAFRNSKASEYSSLSGTKKKGAKLKVKPNLKAEPKSNVKVIGKNDSSLKQRYPSALSGQYGKASWEMSREKFLKDAPKQAHKKAKAPDKKAKAPKENLLIKPFKKRGDGPAGVPAKKK